MFPNTVYLSGSNLIYYDFVEAFRWSKIAFNKGQCQS